MADPERKIADFFQYEEGFWERPQPKMGIVCYPDHIEPHKKDRLGGLLHHMDRKATILVG